jgi:predicted membrane metal-binding protein
VSALREHPRHLLVGCAAVGLLLCELSSTWLLVAAALAAILVSCVQQAHVAVAAAAMILMAGGIGEARLAAIDADPLANNSASEFAGHAVELPRTGAHGMTRLRVRVFSAGGQRLSQLVELRTREDIGAARIGAELRFSGRDRMINVQAERTASARRAAELLLRNGVRRRVDARAVQLTGQRRGGLTGFVDRIRDRSDAAIAAGLGTESAALLRGMVLGGDHGISEPTVEAFRVSGLAHVLASNKKARTGFP